MYVMSALKLTATATASSIYVRTATKSKSNSKPQPHFLLLWTPTSNSSRTIHLHHHHHQPGGRSRRVATPYAYSLPPSPIINNPTLRFSIPKPLPFSSHNKPTSSTSTSRVTLSNANDPSPSSSLIDNENENEPSKLLTLPTILTLARVAAVPLLVTTFYVDGWGGTAATTTIFIAAAFTDWLDGYLARKMKLKSSFGAFLDPVADKLMVAATLVLLCTRPLDVAAFGQAPWLLTIPAIAIIGREITMSAVREWAASQDSKLLEAVAVNNLGKWKTATQMTALTILLAARDWSHGGAAIVVGSGVGLLYTSAGLAIWSLIVYMKKIWKVMRR